MKRTRILITILLLALLNVATLNAEQATSYSRDSVNTQVEIQATGGADKPVNTISAYAEKVQKMLVGKWSNPYFAMPENDAKQNSATMSLKIHFYANGTYVKMMDGAEMQIEEKGTWDINAAGTELVMHSDLCDGKAQQSVQVATIKHLQLDELVLEQAMCVAGINVSTKPQDFYFNRY